MGTSYTVHTIQTQAQRTCTDSTIRCQRRRQTPDLLSSLFTPHIGTHQHQHQPTKTSAHGQRVRWHGECGVCWYNNRKEMARDKLRAFSIHSQCTFLKAAFASSANEHTWNHYYPDKNLFRQTRTEKRYSIDSPCGKDIEWRRTKNSRDYFSSRCKCAFGSQRNRPLFNALSIFILSISRPSIAPDRN